MLDRRLNKIDLRFRKASFETFHPHSEQQAQALERMMDNVTGNFYLCGDYGVGKTHLLVSQYRELCLDRACEFRSTHALMEEMRQAEFKEESLIFQRIDGSESFHLFWDDIDKLRLTDFRREMIFHLVDLLYRRKQGLSITSNLTLKELVDEDIIPSGVVRRIDDMCTVVSLQEQEVPF